MRPAVRLRVRPGRVTGMMRRGRHLIWRGEARFESTGELADVIVRLAGHADATMKGARLSVELVRPLVQLRELTRLPPVRQSDLVRLVGQQRSRFFRKNGRTLVSDAVWLERRRGGPCRALGAAVDEVLVRSLVEGAEQAGLELESVRPSHVGRALNLLPDDERQQQRVRLRRNTVRLYVTAAALWLLVGTGYLVQLTSSAREVAGELTAIEAPLAALRQVRRELGLATEGLDAVQFTQTTRSDLLNTIHRVAAALPDSAYVNSFSWDELGAGRITGVARRAVKVVNELESADAVVDPRLDGQPMRRLVREKRWETFTIVYGLEVRP